MSLDDRFNPDDGNFIDRYDNRLRLLHKRLAEAWQYRTHSSATELQRLFYGASCAAFLFYGFQKNRMLAIIIGIMAGSKATDSTLDSQTGLEEEIDSEAMGLPRKFDKYVRTGIFTVSGILSLYGIGNLLAGFVTGDNFYYTKATEDISLAAGGLGWMGGDYIGMSNLPPPPPKPRREFAPVIIPVK